MTKKDYELVAEAMSYSINSLSDVYFQRYYQGWKHSCEILADYLQMRDSKFDRNKFLATCGIED